MYELCDTKEVVAKDLNCLRYSSCTACRKTLKTTSFFDAGLVVGQVPRRRKFVDEELQRGRSVVVGLQEVGLGLFENAIDKRGGIRAVADASADVLPQRVHPPCDPSSRFNGLLLVTLTEKQNVVDHITARCGKLSKVRRTTRLNIIKRHRNRFA